MESVGLVGLCKIELPDGDVLLCDGGFITWGADTYRSKDAVFGMIASIDALGEGVGDEVPALEMVLYPDGDAEPGDLSQPGFQTSRCRFWIAEYDTDNAVVGTPDLLFDGQIDRTMLTVGATRELAMSIVSLAERLFEMNTGNTLNPTWHKSIWPGELGHDNATGLAVQVAWGASKPTGTSTGTSGGGFWREMLLRQHRVPQ
jgi:hypothetical protein